ncbi:unnamed protein product [Bursaphelenchus okinawaensis]|uniref:T-box domain-containing protein n=1 Tax=Bursaphelenchus okinawaensis TaxID=465554 RepID=A0A811K9Z3_9BILA|nr:unnamed protein product [Bursaphelenchus okinawaensis]CAG9098100.1 unnamed protein product [Bursaphelenchus okinawaensis]
MAKRTISSCSSSPSSKKCKFSIDDILNSTTLLQTAALIKAEDDNDKRNEETSSPLDLQPNINWVPEGNSASLSGLNCRLEGKEMWAQFYKLGTEMIITKCGRRMFPTVKIRLEGCEPNCQYDVFLDVIPVDGHRYRYMYNKSSWQTCGKAEPSPQARLYLHPDSPHDGRGLDNNIITFEKAKLTNNADDTRVGHLVLNSMHKYQPRVHVVIRRDGKRSRMFDPSSSDFDIRNEEYRTFVFDETKFMAVTAYQNQLITKLKIEKNPFAKGFRDPNGRGNDFSDIFSSPCPEPTIFLKNLLQFASISPMFSNQTSNLYSMMCPPGGEMFLPWNMNGNMNRFCNTGNEDGKKLAQPSTSSPPTPIETNVSVDDSDEKSSVYTVKTDVTL